MTNFIFNNKLVFIHFILILLLNNGCKEDKTNELDYVTIKISGHEDKLSFLSFIKIIGEAPLEMSNESLFTEINNLYLYENEYYIFDSKIGSVFVFDIEGNYRRRIGKKGHAPGELVNPSDFGLNPQTKEIEILDVLEKFILQYTLEGEFISKKEFSDRYPKMFITQNADYIYMLAYDMPYKEEYMLSYRSSEVERKILPVTNQVKQDGNFDLARNTFSTYGEDILFWKIFNDTIYRITPDPVIHKIYIDFGKRKLPNEILNTPLEKRIQILGNPEQKYFIFINDVIGFGNKLLFSCSSKEVKRFFIHDFEEQTTHQVDMGDRQDVKLFSVGDNQFVLSYQVEDEKMEESIELIHFRFK